MSIIINNTDITIRPSSISTHFSCAYQWAKVYLEGVNTIPGGRSCIGTAIHESADVLWKDAIATKVKDVNVTKLTDAAVANLQEQNQELDIRWDDNENIDTAEGEVVGGVKAFLDDIVPMLDIPIASEVYFEVALNNPLVAKVGGTIDYLSEDYLDDVKTSKRKISAAAHTVQQSTYKFLAEANGHNVIANRIQGVVLNKNPYGMHIELQPKVEQAKFLINNILDKMTIASKDIVDLEVLFPGNPKYHLCSAKYCSLYPCKFVKGE